VYQHYVTAMKAQAEGKWDAWAAKNPEIAAAFKQAEDMGVRTGGMSVHEVERNVGTRANWKPWSSDFAPLSGFRRGAHVGDKLVMPGGQQVENLARGTLFMDRILKGRDVSEAYADVMKYHFDYEDLGKMETAVGRRVIPFYTWTRKNLPLQLELLAKKPQKINRFYQLKRSIEAQSEEEGVVPEWYEDAMAVRMPFKLGGGQAYGFPDMLPQQQLHELADPGMFLGMTTPFVKAPLEWHREKQLYKGVPLSTEQQPVPTAMAVVPGLMPALESLGFAEKAEQGWTMRDKDLYLVDQYMPAIAKARRLFPNDERFEDRRMASMLSTFLGVGLRPNTQSEQETELWRQYFDLKEREQRFAA
jgi:hypothetical protein